MFTKVRDIDRLFGAMDLFRNKMDRIFGEFDRPYLYGQAFETVSTSPRTNFLENGDRFEVQAEVPGIAKDDLNIKIQGNYLEISGTRNLDHPEGYKIHRNERGTASFTRSFTLPEDVDTQKVEATIKNGILYLSLPKSETAKPRQITIN